MPRQGGQGKGKPKMKDRNFGKSLTKYHAQGYKGETRNTASGPNMMSMLESSALEDFIAVVEMEDTEVEVHRATGEDPFIIETSEPIRIQEFTATNFTQEQVIIPRKPAWDYSMTAEDVDRNERTSFLQWRRQISSLEMSRSQSLKITPFEKNLEVWRQLWRVCERSDFVVQVVDARTPLMYYTPDLHKYVSELTPPRVMLLLVNKADLLTEYQRLEWSRYFQSKNIHSLFYSARDSQEELDTHEELAGPFFCGDLSDLYFKFKEFFLSLNIPSLEEYNPNSAISSASRNLETVERDQEDEDDIEEEQMVWGDNKYASSAQEVTNNQQTINSSGISFNYQSAVLSRQELLGIMTYLSRVVPRVNANRTNNRMSFGMVGYPNVGKSSVINTLLGVSRANHGKARVGVSSTPGKTKHFQTLMISQDIMLCDCPGLVFPSFMSNTGEMLCAGMLPINQMRDYNESASIIAARIPTHLLNAVYGIDIIRDLDIMDNPNRPPTGSEMLSAYCKVKGYITGHTGRWDEFRACKEVLRDFNDGKILSIAIPPLQGKNGDWLEKDIDYRANWVIETEKTMASRSKVLSRLQIQQSKKSEEIKEPLPTIFEFIPDNADSQRLDNVIINEDGEIVYEFVPDSVLEEEIENEMAASQAMENESNIDGAKREHKRLKAWGKKGRKLRNKDPYGEDMGTINYVVRTKDRNNALNKLSQVKREAQS